jgi:hypothetical protein
MRLQVLSYVVLHYPALSGVVLVQEINAGLSVIAFRYTMAEESDTGSLDLASHLLPL